MAAIAAESSMPVDGAGAGTGAGGMMPASAAPRAGPAKNQHWQVCTWADADCGNKNDGIL